MVLVNALIGAAEDLEFRIHLRNEFFALEFGHIFEVSPSFVPKSKGKR